MAVCGRSWLVATIAVAAAGTGAHAEALRYDFHLAPQPLKYALRSVTRTAGLELLASSDVLKGKQAPPLDGHFTLQEALDTLLAGSGLTAQINGQTVFVRGRDLPPAEEVTGTAEEPGKIVVTGSRIRGAPVASQVTTITGDDMRDAGQHNLGEVIRALPQNAPGGQNPGVVAGSNRLTDGNVNSTSSLNLRGLGPDATLTLLNGHRVSYDSAIQSVDITSIPVVAVDRMEIVADGASALYGSDAVAGVANIVLRRDYDGIYTSARIGSATRGGDFEQQYDALAGKTWNGGGAMAAVEYGRSTAVTAGDRSFTSAMDPSATLLPHQQYTDAVLNGHQDITPNLRFEIDGTYSERRSTVVTPLTNIGGVQANGTVGTPKLRSFTVSPKLSLDLPLNWRVSLSGTYGEDRTKLGSSYFFGGTVLESFPGHYDNGIGAVELNGEGPLFALPGGTARLALGGGWRSNSLDLDLATVIGSVRQENTIFSKSRAAAFGYGELFLPFISPELDIVGVYRLSASAALRYESYPDVGHVATPKFGLIYEPIEDIELRGSWGKSFKAPTLYQQYSGTRAVLLDPSNFGASGLPAGSTVLDRQGSNPDLKPEKATTWTTTLAFHPRSLPGLKAELTYFHTVYRDRIVQPLLNDDGALTNPIYQPIITPNPGVGLLDAVIADAAVGLENFAGVPYNPASVVALVDDRFRNTAEQRIQGVDLSADYRIALKRRQSITLHGLATWLDSRQQLSALQPANDLSGTIFNPPRWRGRLGMTWAGGSVTLAGYANYIGGLTDNRHATALPVGSMTTADASIHYHNPDRHGLLGELEVDFSVANLTDARPPRIATSAPWVPPYDSTNFSALGRTISLTIGKRW